MEVEAAMELVRHLDQTGLHQVYTCLLRNFVNKFYFYICLLINLVYTRFTPDLHKVCVVYTEFAPCLLSNGYFSPEFIPIAQCVNFVQIMGILCKLLQTFCKQTGIYEARFAQCKLNLAPVNFFGRSKHLQKV